MKHDMLWDASVGGMAETMPGLPTMRRAENQTDLDEVGRRDSAPERLVDGLGLHFRFDRPMEPPNMEDPENREKSACFL